MEAFKANYMKGADKYRLLDPQGNNWWNKRFCRTN